MQYGGPRVHEGVELIWDGKDELPAEEDLGLTTAPFHCNTEKAH